MTGFSVSRANIRKPIRIFTDYGAARAMNESFGLAAYATWKHTDGWYADGVLSWDRYHQKISDHMLDGTPVSGSYNRYALGASIEAGRHFKLANDVFIEPQLQLSYFWLKGKNFTMDNGLAVDTKNADVVTGRAGLVLGKNGKSAKTVMSSLT